MTTPDPYDPTRPDSGSDWTQPQQPQDAPPGYVPPTMPMPGPGQPAYGQPGTGPADYGPQPGYAGGFPPPPPGFGPGGVPYPSYGFDAYGRPLSDKSKVVAGVLGIVLGGFGVGRFYIGDNRTGVLQLIVTIFTCGLGHFWGLIDGILILVNGGVDAQGRVLRD